MVLRFLALLGALLALALPAQAQVSEPDRGAIRDVIERQIEAFRRDDGEAAFGYASPAIQGMFGSPDTFMDMVRQGYRPVYRPRAVEFREIVTLEGMVTQKVHVIGPDGRPVTAFYPMSRQADGSWRIEGCYLQASEEPQA
ncbi:DUF4864 domain-containing protein [Reyranella sp.]|uniref:DUF4864 domain-containing protein n=1 Tax=Reyranella sp. TaxID=1929291 RepID=UPI00403757CD